MNNKSTKVALYSLGAIVLFTAFFYFYTAEIFEAEVVEYSANYTLDISLKAYLDHNYLPEVVSVNSLISVSPTIKGIFLLIICLVGVPIMIGYRIATNKPESKNDSSSETREEG